MDLYEKFSIFQNPRHPFALLEHKVFFAAGVF